MLYLHPGFVKPVVLNEFTVSYIDNTWHLKHFPKIFTDLLKIAIKVINFIKNGASNSRQFETFCSDLGLEHKKTSTGFQMEACYKPDYLN